uniref:receptor protein-tyrosine kinase CEPR1-like n=1 Tax=Erigeron canadensis TaxID=72917 RepID=UPI001CB8D73A|nr:receptor protein-tyrosine kinase CEPR1-like [Erigeron canadensis]
MGFAYKFIIVYLVILLPLPTAYEANQVDFFTRMKDSLSVGTSLMDWDDDRPACNYTGVSCDKKGYVIKIDITGWGLSGHFPENVCSLLPRLRILRVGYNKFHGDFPQSITNCSLLEELNVAFTNLTGKLPDLSPMKSLKLLDMSNNLFTGKFPISFINLINLEVVNFNENAGFNMWTLPENVSRLVNLKSMILSTCVLSGPIPKSIGNMTSLIDLELSGNFLVGPVPREIGLLRNLQQLELYYNQLVGEIPHELGNLTELFDLDMSVNKLTGTLPESICRLPKLQVLQLYNNSLTGEIPQVLENSTTLTMLSLYSNYLTGEVPRKLGRSSPLTLVDLSENNLTGELPSEVCNGGKLLYFLALGNMFSGFLPESYGKCASLIRFRVSSNRLEGKIPDGILGLPSVSIIDLSYNFFNGSIPKVIGNARNLSELFLQNNMIAGVVPSEISKAINLVKIDLSNNLLFGPIPTEIGNIKRLNLLILQGNKLTSSIPSSLSSIKSLNVLDLSRNQLTGSIPKSLCDLLPGSMNFSYNQLSGPIPTQFIKGGELESFVGNKELCISAYSYKVDQAFALCSQTSNQKKLNSFWVIIVSVGVMLIGVIIFLRRCLNRETDITKHEETWACSYFSYNVKSFHHASFNQHEIIDGMIEKNVVGHGGSGTVYKVDLSNGEVVAVKRFWSQKWKDGSSNNQQMMDRELKSEIETLSNIRHKNIIKLYCYMSSCNCNLLVYQYMPNGSLWDALHQVKCCLDWPTRHQIALGIAKGLAYLHHDLLPPIIHRDVKSTNILLDINFNPKVADFGLAKVLHGRGKDSTTTVVAGTYGYLAPEYAYTSKATTKCDVYSFGVVLMELITGKKPVEAEYGENKNIIYWISSKVETKEGAMEILDRRLSGVFKDEMIKVLRVAILCTCRTATLRPTMNEVVQMLIHTDPCGSDTCKSTNKAKETTKET